VSAHSCSVRALVMTRVCARHGLAVDEVAVAPLEANPNAVWTVKRHISDPHDSYLVVSFVNATLVLSIGGESVEEVSDSGLLGTAPTLMVALIGDDALLQAHAGGLRHVRADKRGQEWKTPGRKQLQHAACNGQQAVVAVSGGELFYFELDALGQLREVQKHDFGKEVCARVVRSASRVSCCRWLHSRSLR
jgi:splicing factor 3B subunit 3